MLKTNSKIRDRAVMLSGAKHLRLYFAGEIPEILPFAQDDKCMS